MCDAQKRGYAKSSFLTYPLFLFSILANHTFLSRFTLIQIHECFLFALLLCSPRFCVLIKVLSCLIVSVLHFKNECFASLYNMFAKLFTCK